VAAKNATSHIRLPDNLVQRSFHSRFGIADGSDLKSMSLDSIRSDKNERLPRDKSQRRERALSAGTRERGGHEKSSSSTESTSANGGVNSGISDEDFQVPCNVVQRNLSTFDAKPANHAAQADSRWSRLFS
jgi:hypothetical protein